MSDRILNDLERLEVFVWASGWGERIMTLDLPPVENAPPRSAGQPQPCVSVDLSEVAVPTSGGKGRLTTFIALIESTDLVGSWQNDTRESGWLSLALPRALQTEMKQIIAFISVDNPTVSRAFAGNESFTISRTPQVKLLPEFSPRRGIVLTLLPEGRATIVIDQKDAFINTSSRDD